MLTTQMRGVIVLTGLLAGVATGQAGAQAPRQTPPAVTVDTKELQTVTSFAARTQPLVDTWYPKIVEALGAEKNPTPPRITVVYELNMDGVAATGGTVIHVSARYVEKHPGDTGMIIHELAHVVQGYPKYDPVWLVEGIADYVRFFLFEPESARPHVKPAQANARASYRTTAAFLDWASRKYDKQLVRKLSQALKADTYTEAMFHDLTGKTLDELNAEWKGSLQLAPATP